MKQEVKRKLLESYKADKKNYIYAIILSFLFTTIGILLIVLAFQKDYLWLTIIGSFLAWLEIKDIFLNIKDLVNAKRNLTELLKLVEVIDKINKE